MADLLNQEVQHTGKPCYCTICDYNTQIKEGLEIHMALHMRMPFSCTKCGYRHAQAILQKSIWWPVLLLLLWVSFQMQLSTSWDNWWTVLVNISKCM